MRNSDDIIYCINKPYPAINIDKPNIRYVNIILPSYSGMVSEYSAISQYVYHSFRLQESFFKVADALEGISIVEMHHLKILAQLLIKLGGNPKFYIAKKDKCYYWNSKFVNYGCSLKEMLTYDIKSEETAIKNYNKIISEIPDKNIQKIIKRIIEDEELHLEIFKKLYKENVE